MAYCGVLSDFLEASEVQGLGQIPVVCEFLDGFAEASFSYLRCVRWSCASCVWDWSRYLVVPIGWHLSSRMNRGTVGRTVMREVGSSCEGLWQHHGVKEATWEWESTI